MLSFKPTFSLFSLSFIKRLFNSSLSAVSVVSSAYLRLMVCLPAILIPGCASSSLAFHMMYSAYKLNEQGDNKQPWCTPFTIWDQSVVPCPVPTVAIDYRITKQRHYFNYSYNLNPFVREARGKTWTEDWWPVGRLAKSLFPYNVTWSREVIAHHMHS